MPRKPKDKCLFCNEDSTIYEINELVFRLHCDPEDQERVKSLLSSHSLNFSCEDSSPYSHIALGACQEHHKRLIRLDELLSKARGAFFLSALNRGHSYTTIETELKKVVPPKEDEIRDALTRLKSLIDEDPNNGRGTMSWNTALSTAMKNLHDITGRYLNE
jgi:hypothetical protein